MQNANEIKKRIITLIENKGPSLPVQISRETKITTLFISAFLSELKDEKKIKISNLKVGGSPLYFLEGQEAMLENFKQYLHPKEQEALELLRKNKILKDSEQEPSIRVALRSIKDFSFPFKKDEELYWRFLTVTEEEVRNLLEPLQPVQINQPQEIQETKLKDIQEKTVVIERPIETSERIREEKSPEIEKKKKLEKELVLNVFDNPLSLKTDEIKPQKIKPKSEFVLRVIKFLEKNNFKIIEEKEYSKKEYNCITQIETTLGPIDFLTQAKDKKLISDKELEVLLRKAQTIPLPALMIYPEKLNKKATEYEKKYYPILKTKKIV